MDHLDFQCEYKTEGDDAGTVSGYGSVFNNVDLGQDIVLPGAFAGAKAGRVKMLWQHDPRQPIGVWDELSEDGKGLKMKGRLALKTVKGAEVYELLQMKALDGLSIGFRLDRKNVDFDPQTNVRKIKRADLHEVSVVTFPMNTRATITGVKSSASKRELEQSLRDAGLSASEAKYVAGLTNLPACVTPADEKAHDHVAMEAFLKSLRDTRTHIGG